MVAIVLRFVVVWHLGLIWQGRLGGNRCPLISAVLGVGTWGTKQGATQRLKENIVGLDWSGMALEIF